MRPQTFADYGIEIPHGRSGEVDTICPQCSHARRKRTARCLSVNTIDGTWFCHHCGWAGGLGMHGTGYGASLRPRVATPAPPRVYALPTPPPLTPLSEPIVAWFAGRGIPERMLTAAGITAGQEWCPQVAGAVLTIRFPYLRDRRLINIKYRAVSEKLFWMVKGAERILYGLDAIVGAETICAVEGEMDALSIRVAGGPSTLSVPDGAPSPNTTHYAGKFTFLDEITLGRLRAAATVLIGTDMDAPGDRLANELAQRIGYATCKRVSWHPYKDANEVLVAEGPQAVLDALAAAEPFPVPPDAAIPHRARPVRLLPPVRGRRPVVELPPVKACHAR
jgi:twinkle protein